MEFQKTAIDELQYVSYLCLWGISRKQREAMKEHMEKRLKWIVEMMPKGLEIIVALGRRKGKKGLIEYLPIEIAPEPVKGRNSLFINCIWVLSRYSKAGIGKGLMQNFLKEARKVGGATVLAYERAKWFGYFEYMPASFFKKFGFEEISRDGARLLLHLDLGAHQFPRLLTINRQKVNEDGKTVLDVFHNRQCPWCGWMVDNIMRNAKHSSFTVSVINTDNRDVIEKFGISRGVSFNGEPVIKRMASWKEIKSALNKFTDRNVHI